MRFPVLPLVLLAPALLLTACDRKAGSIDTDYPLTRLTERVYVIHGPNEMPNEANQAFMNNPGFVLTPKGVVVVDPGSSVQVGEMLLKKIATVTRDPVIAVFNTHIHGDHWLGNDAIRRAHPKAVIYAHPNMIAKAAVEGENWIERMNQLSDGAVRGTQVVVPQLGLDNDETLTVGGLHFRLYHTGVAHTDGDLMIEVVEEKVLFLGDNVVAERAGRLDDGNFTGNIAACDAALKTGATKFVPGHGVSGGREVVTAYRTWLATLYGSVKKHYEAGVGAIDMKDKVVPELAAYRKWALFDSEIGKLVSLATLQAEQEAF
jgi:glyoxylase-like metal-dependent hydrolase (beta-lactamase superfamily II)